MHQQCTGGLNLGFQLCLFTDKSLPEWSFIFGRDPNHFLFYFWQDTWPCDKAINHFNLLPLSAAWPSSVRSPTCQRWGQDLNYGPVKLEISFLCSLVWRLRHCLVIYLGILRISVEQIQNGLLFPMKKKTKINSFKFQADFKILWVQKESSGNHFKPTYLPVVIGILYLSESAR